MMSEVTDNIFQFFANSLYYGGVAYQTSALWLMDEAQDTSGAFDLVCTSLSRLGVIMVKVGDHGQMIFAWAGASGNWQEVEGHCVRQNLSLCWRFGFSICRVANLLNQELSRVHGVDAFELHPNLAIEDEVCGMDTFLGEYGSRYVNEKVAFIGRCNKDLVTFLLHTATLQMRCFIKVVKVADKLRRQASIIRGYAVAAETGKLLAILFSFLPSYFTYC
jgi:hypothetical protein